MRRTVHDKSPTRRDSETTGAAIISIVDDDASMRGAIEDLVCAHGWLARTFDSADAFLRSGDAQRTACLIIDIQMPDMNGEELHATLKARGWRIPVIFVTAFSEGSGERGDDGVIARLAKPFEGHALLRCLDEAVAPQARGKSAAGGPGSGRITSS